MGLFGGSFQRDVALPFEVLKCRGQGHPRLCPRHFDLSPFVLSKYPPRHGPWALVERGLDHKFPGPTVSIFGFIILFEYDIITSYMEEFQHLNVQLLLNNFMLPYIHKCLLFGLIAMVKQLTIFL